MYKFHKSLITFRYI